MSVFPCMYSHVTNSRFHVLYIQHARHQPRGRHYDGSHDATAAGATPRTPANKCTLGFRPPWPPTAPATALSFTGYGAWRERPDTRVGPHGGCTDGTGHTTATGPLRGGAGRP